MTLHLITKELKMSFLLAIDQGTTGSTALVIDVTEPLEPELVSKSNVRFQQHFPEAGWVEHDLDDIWQSVASACTEALDLARQKLSAFSKNKIVAIGITNQRETLAAFDRHTSKPLAKAIVWQCKRSQSICLEWKRTGLESQFRGKTGLILDPYFSASKVAWYLKNNPDVKSKIESGSGVFGTIDTFLCHRLTACASFVTESSNASRTMLYDIHREQWDEELLNICGLKNSSSLPEVRESSGLFGKTKGVGFLPDGIPITGILGDQQAALAGQTCFKESEAKCTYGTGAFLLMNTGSKAVTSKAGMLTTIAWKTGNQTTYALEGASFIAGAAVQFLRDQLGIITFAGETAQLAADAKAAPHLYFVPALSGLGAPWWQPEARGAFLGMHRGTTRGEISRAALEGIAFQVHDLVKAMEQDLGKPISNLRVDGGASANDLLMQIQANYLQAMVDRPQVVETTAFGAALFAGLGVGLYKDLSECRNARHADRVFTPSNDNVTEHLKGWNRAVQAVIAFASP
jgi:glycerol kinase